jgi:glycerol-1-phosphate dehydrogenase [NAD(P)+]
MIEGKIDYTLYNFGNSPAPDEKAVGSAFMHMPYGADAIISVGSGVLNDIGKIVAAAAGKLYVIVATAPSMDGYASATSSMARDGLKVSINSKCPDVIIGDADVLATAPMRMKLSGLGDMIAKFSAIAEWRIANIILGEYYCENVAELIRTALRRCIAAADKLLLGDADAANAVFEGLVLGGAAMNLAGCSRPASGCEHYISHIVDMRALEFGTEEEPHGIQCAAATLICARIADRLRGYKPDKEKALSYAAGFDKNAWFERLRKLLGSAAESMIKQDSKEKKYDKDKHAERIEAIISNIDRIYAVMSEELPPEKELTALFDKIGLDKTLTALDPELLPEVLRASKDIRDKYVISRLLWDLGILDEYADLLKEN